jgi:arabinogalactan oligomer / maltooligosaccharide transport system permease protein
MASINLMTSRRTKFWMKRVLWRHIVGLVVTSFSIFPLVWMISAAFDVTGQLSTQQLIPVHAGFDNFTALFSNAEKPFLIWARNSIVIAVSASIMQTAIGAVAAYSLSRHRFRGRKLTLSTILVAQMFPQLLAATTLFLIINNLGQTFPFLGLGHQLPLILLFGGTALGVNTWMLKSFFDTIPSEIDEAATIDGAGHFQIFISIIIPLAIPVFVVIFLLSFIGILNEYLITSVILGLDGDKMTVAVGLQQFIYGNYGKNWGPFTAGALIATIPVLTLFLILQKYLVSGLVSGSTKG